MGKLAILGASGHGKVVADTARQCGWDQIEFFDDAWPQLNKVGTTTVTGDTDALIQRVEEFSGVLVGIGNTRIRLNKSLQLQAAGLTLVSLVHPKAYVSEDTAIGAGTVIFAGAVVQPGASIGLAVIVNTGATVDHGCVLAQGVHVCPGAHLAGDVNVGECSWIGIGAAVNQYLRIGKNVNVGSGAAVIANVPDNVTIVGVPARIVTQGSSQSC